MKLTAINGKDTEGLFGAVTYWNGTSIDIKLQALKDALDAAGLGALPLPSLPGPEGALARAVRHSRSTRDGFKRFTRFTKNAWYVVDEQDDNAGEPQWSAGLKVSCNAVGQLSFTPPTHPLQQAITDAWKISLESVTGQDISRWLCQMAAMHDAVTLRDNGGTYFVPRLKLPEWRKLAKVVKESCAFKVYEIPAAESSDEAISSIVEAVTDALLAESEAEIQAIHQRVFNPDEDQRKLGARAIQGRIRHTDALAERVAMYEGLLGTKLSALSEKLESLRSSLSIAMLTGDAEEAPVGASVAA